MDNVQSNDFERWLRDFAESVGATSVKPWERKCLWLAWADGYKVGFEDGNVEAYESTEEP